VSASTVASLHETAQDLLDVFETAVAGTTAGFSGRVALTPGIPALDAECNTVYVWAQGIADEQTSPFGIAQSGQRRRLSWVNLVTLYAQVTRCIASGRTQNPPSEAQLSADARMVMEDGWAIWNAVSTAIRDGGLFGGPCNDVHFVGMTPYGPQGGMAGWTFQAQVALDGYDVELGT
jgi:hypothetical protein